MIVAVGLDLIEIRRIRRDAERHPERFIARCFHPEELAELAGRADVYPGLAVRFAAKEAFAKVWPTSAGATSRRNPRPPATQNGGSASMPAAAYTPRRSR